MKILVVDDSKVMRMVVRRALSEGAYGDATVVEATNGREGLEAVAAESPDVVLSDWNMPEMSGIEFLEELSRRAPLPPFGFVTSESTPEMYERATAAGARFLVSKPFTPAVLSSALDDAL